MAKPLTERRNADRATMAASVIALCAEMGAAVERTERERMIRLEITIGAACVGIEFDGGPFNSQPDCFCMPWNTVRGSSARMSSAFGCAVRAEVNPFHRAKCMGFADGFGALLDRLRDAMACINSGRAFEAAITTVDSGAVAALAA